MTGKFVFPWRNDARPDFSQLKNALTREKTPDYVPLYELYANPDTIAELVGNADAGPSFYRFYLWAGYDYVPVWPLYTMPLGSLVDTSKPYPVKDLADLAAYPWPKTEDFSFEPFHAAARAIPAGMRIIGQTGGPFEMAQQLLGYETLCYYLYDEPGLVEAMFDQIGDFYARLYTNMAEQPGVGALVISDDMGYKNGTMISAAHLRQYVKPIHANLVRIAHEAGLPCILHSCGNLDEIIDEWIDDVQMDAKHSFEDSIHPVEEMYEKYSDRVAILGGYDLNRLCHDSVGEVDQRCRRLIEMGKKGGYALGSGNSIPHFVPKENYRAMLMANKRAREGK